MNIIRIIFLDNFLFQFFGIVCILNLLFIICVILKIQGRLV